MFTGIISNRGSIKSLKNIDGAIEFIIICDNNDFFSETHIGDSISVNGVCLTVTNFDNNSFTTFAQIETIDKTTLGNLVIDEKVNLEHPLRLSDRLGGHLVQGHADGIAKIKKIDPLTDGSIRICIEPSQDLMKYISQKGSVSIDGVSLTIASRSDKDFDVALIPTTIEKTGFVDYLSGTLVNIEVDCLARYVDQLMNK